MRCALFCLVTLSALFEACSASAEYFPDTAMPQGRGCRVTHCVPIDDGYRRGRRCFWRCPRTRSVPPPRHYAPPPPPSVPDPPRRYRPPAQDPPRYQVAAPTSAEFPEGVGTALIVLGSLIALALAAAVARHFEALSQARHTDRAFSEAAAAAAVEARLQQAMREAENVIKRQSASAFRRGRHSQEH